MNIGYWTRQNEEWFLHRRQEIREACTSGDTPKLKLRTGNAWRRSLRYEVDAQRVFVANLEALSASVLYSPSSSRDIGDMLV